MIRIYSKKSFAIGPGASRGGTVDKQFITVPQAIQEMPEGLAKDPTFKLAVKAGDIIVMTKEVVSPAVANSVPDDVLDEIDKTNSEETGLDAKVKEFYNTLKTKNHAEVKELAEEYGAEFVESDKLSMNKKRVLEAYKVSLNK